MKQQCNNEEAAPGVSEPGAIRQYTIMSQMCTTESDTGVNHFTGEGFTSMWCPPQQTPSSVVCKQRAPSCTSSPRELGTEVCLIVYLSDKKPLCSDLSHFICQKPIDPESWTGLHHQLVYGIFVKLMLLRKFSISRGLAEEIFIWTQKWLCG